MPNRTAALRAMAEASDSVPFAEFPLKGAAIVFSLPLRSRGARVRRPSRPAPAEPSDDASKGALPIRCVAKKTAPSVGVADWREKVSAHAAKKMLSVRALRVQGGPQVPAPRGFIGFAGEQKKIADRVDLDPAALQLAFSDRLGRGLTGGRNCPA